MRTTQKISITVPQELLEKIDHLAQEEDRSRSGILRTAVRFYLNEKHKDKKSSAEKASLR